RFQYDLRAALAGRGGAIGAAFELWHRLAGARSFVMDHAYWGPQFSSGDIQGLMAARQPEIDADGGAWIVVYWPSADLIYLTGGLKIRRAYLIFGDIEGKLDVLRVWEYRPALRTL